MDLGVLGLGVRIISPVFPLPLSYPHPLPPTPPHSLDMLSLKEETGDW